jgi:hypothetical protein
MFFDRAERSGEEAMANSNIPPWPQLGGECPGLHSSTWQRNPRGSTRFGHFPLDRISAPEAEMGKYADGLVGYDPEVLQYLLEFNSRFCGHGVRPGTRFRERRPDRGLAEGRRWWAQEPNRKEGRPVTFRLPASHPCG